MPDLTIQVQEIKGLSGTALVVLNGSIDAKTVIQFQTQLNTVKERGLNRFILDMENVKYVNSTGLGYLINLSDSITGEHGGITLVKVQPKVKVVFDMLGLNAFFKIYPTRDEALKHFTSGAEVPSATDQTVVMKAGQEKSTATQAPVPRVAVAVAEPPRSVAPPPVAPQVVRAPDETTTTIECQSCKSLLAIKDAGTYKCPRCLTLFNYDTAGKASFLPRRKSLPVQLSLNFSDDATEGLVGFVRLTALRAGFTDGAIPEMEKAVRETVRTIQKYAYAGNDNNIYHVMLVNSGTEIEIRFADYGTSIPADKSGDDGKPLFSSARGSMDRFELRNHPKGGNVLTVSKKVR